MNTRNKCCLLSLLLLFMFLFAGIIECSGIGTNVVHSPYKGVRANSRKLMEFNAVLDYDYAGPNPKHEPRGKRGGGGSKNP